MSRTRLVYVTLPLVVVEQLKKVCPSSSKMAVDAYLFSYLERVLQPSHSGRGRGSSFLPAKGSTTSSREGVR